MKRLFNILPLSAILFVGMFALLVSVSGTPSSPKQISIIVTRDKQEMRSLLKRGYICEDVDITFSQYAQVSKMYYTMVKY